MHKKYKEVIKKVVPVHRNELARFLCTFMLMFLIISIHSILHISKDALVISHLGAEAISAMKIWAVLPISLLFMFLYIKLSDKFSRSQLFYIVTWFFIAYFVLFALILYPHRDALTIKISEDLIFKLSSIKYLFKIISYWPYALFYVFSEGWVAIMLSISFWQVANHITSIEESKRFYPLFGIAAGTGKMMASVLSTISVAHGENWQPTLNRVTIFIVIAGIGISVCLFALEKIVGGKNFNFQKSHFRTKSKMSLKNSLKYIASSKIILLIASLLLCYNTTLNLVEGVWKKSIEVFFGNNPNQIHQFISKVDIYISVLSIISAFFSVYILQRLSWKTSALITPIIVFVTGGIFFLFVFLRNTSSLLALQTSPILIAVYFGAIYNIFSRSSKHTLFDPTKERVYIPLDDDLKTKGKAAAETFGLRFGKGNGAFVQQLLFALFPTMTLLDLSPIIFGIFLMMLLWWLYATLILNKEQVKTTKKMERKPAYNI